MSWSFDRCSGTYSTPSRTIDEIAAWGVLNNAQKREVWKLLPQRRRAVDATRNPSS